MVSRVPEVSSIAPSGCPLLRFFTLVIYIRDTYGINDAVLLSKVVDRDIALVLKWLDEKADNK